MVYDVFYPFRKRSHLTLSQYLSQRDEDGWKLTYLQRIGHAEDRVKRDVYTRSETDVLIALMNNLEQIEPDKLVKPVPRFTQGLKELLEFMASDTPLIIVVRLALLVLLLYEFLDASGSGFGGTMYRKGKIHY